MKLLSSAKGPSLTTSTTVRSNNSNSIMTKSIHRNPSSRSRDQFGLPKEDDFERIWLSASVEESSPLGQEKKVHEKSSPPVPLSAFFAREDEHRNNDAKTRTGLVFRRLRDGNNSVSTSQTTPTLVHHTSSSTGKSRGGLGTLGRLFNLRRMQSAKSLQGVSVKGPVAVVSKNIDNSSNQNDSGNNNGTSSVLLNGLSRDATMVLRKIRHEQPTRREQSVTTSAGVTPTSSTSAGTASSPSADWFCSPLPVSTSPGSVDVLVGSILVVSNGSGTDHPTTKKGKCRTYPTKADASGGYVGGDEELQDHRVDDSSCAESSLDHDEDRTFYEINNRIAEAAAKAAAAAAAGTTAAGLAPYRPMGLDRSLLFYDVKESENDDNSSNNDSDGYYCDYYRYYDDDPSLALTQTTDATGTVVGGIRNDESDPSTTTASQAESREESNVDDPCIPETSTTDHVFPSLHNESTRGGLPAQTDNDAETCCVCATLFYSVNRRSEIYCHTCRMLMA